jgi:agmatinase
MDISEKEHMDLDKTYFAHEIHNRSGWMHRALHQMTDNVFITIDLDAFDPSFMPSTGTPEPGGLGFYQVMEFLKLIFDHKKVVGFDIVELAANPNEKSSDFVAAKLYYKMLSYKFQNKAQ